MSETVHYKGKLTPTGKALSEFAPDAEDIYDIDLYKKVVEIDGVIFTVEMESIDEHEDIFEATKNDDGTINFETKYYDGGCGFSEAIDRALESKD